MSDTAVHWTRALVTYTLEGFEHGSSSLLLSMTGVRPSILEKLQEYGMRYGFYWEESLDMKGTVARCLIAMNLGRFGPVLPTSKARSAWAHAVVQASSA